MSHFVMGIIVPEEGMELAEQYIHQVMKKYSEHLEVEPYIDKTKQELTEEFERWRQDKIEQVSELDPEVKKLVTSEITLDLLNEWVYYWHGTELDENGNLVSTYNQDSKWDWYRVGGRWDGFLTDNKQSSDNGFNFADKHETVKNNVVKVKKHLKKLTKDKKAFKKYAMFGLVDKNGEWHENGSMGWWGIVTDPIDKNAWKKQYIKILEDSLDRWIVCVDCHI